eukprot:9220778-Prorocentrum_lima.AAC.1
MTSSLVGSEMCIRDRRGAAGGEGVALLHDGLARFHLRGLADQNLVDAVSYTHLTLPTICSV